MDAHQDFPAGRGLALDEREMRFLADPVAVGVEAQASAHRVDITLGGAGHERFGAAAVMDEIGDGADLQAVLLGEDLQIGQPRHLAVILENLADHGRRREARKPRQIAARLRVTRAHQYAALVRHQREDMPGLHDVLRA